MAGRNSCFVRSDANDDGTLMRSEVRRLFQARPAEQLEASLSRLDRDRDGQISREEFDRESAAVFQFLDTNGDAVIAGMELSALTITLAGDLCQPSGSPDAGDGRARGGPPGGPGPRSPR
jgi:Ca2+-binding EF-hand superfamily protein